MDRVVYLSFHDYRVGSRVQSEGKMEIRAYVRPVDRLTPAKNADTVDGVNREVGTLRERIRTQDGVECVMG